MTPFAVIDVETTGLFPRRGDRIIEIAVLRISEEGLALGSLETLVNPSRDVGPTHIHGITAAEVLEAPRFEDVAGELFELLSGAVVVSHNIPFDTMFLEAESERCGWSLPERPTLCTMKLASETGFASSGRSLAARCAEAGVLPERRHAAGADARAAAGLLLKCLGRAPRAAELPPGAAVVPRERWPAVPPTGRRLGRSEASALIERRPSFLADLVRRLPADLCATTTTSLGCIGYMALLDRVLEDRRVTEDETEALLEVASDYGLSSAEVLRTHNAYLDGVICAALRDGNLSDAEERDLSGVARLLGIARDDWVSRSNTARSVLERSTKPRLRSAAGPSVPVGRPFEGQTVCFTGALQARIQGARLSRERAEALAAEAGLVVSNNVTRALDLLGVADPDTVSTKARKARDYGTRILAERAFWTALGVSLDEG